MLHLKQKLLLLVTISFAIIALISACKDSNEPAPKPSHPIVGKWKLTEVAPHVYREDGICFVPDSLWIKVESEIYQRYLADGKIGGTFFWMGLYSSDIEAGVVIDNTDNVNEHFWYYIIDSFICYMRYDGLHIDDVDYFLKAIYKLSEDNNELTLYFRESYPIALIFSPDFINFKYIRVEE